MNTIRLNKNPTFFNKATTQAAEEWNAMSCYRLLKICNLLFNKDLKLTQSQWKYAILYQVLDANWYNISFLYKFFRLPKIDIVCSLFPLIKWIEKGNTLTEFKLKSYRIWFTRYYAPKDGLSNITLDEFKMADSLYTEYKKTNDIDYLDGLVAVLYRKKRSDYNPKLADYKGDIREDYNEFLVSNNSKKSEKLTLNKKHLIYLTYEGARNNIINNHPHLFNSSEDQTKGKNFGFGGVIMELSGNKFGTEKETKKSNLIKAFDFLEMEAINIEKARSKKT